MDSGVKIEKIEMPEFELIQTSVERRSSGNFRDHGSNFRSSSRERSNFRTSSRANSRDRPREDGWNNMHGRSRDSRPRRPSGRSSSSRFSSSSRSERPRRFHSRSSSFRR